MQVEALEQKLSLMASSMSSAQTDRVEMVRKAVEATQGRADLALRQQQLEYSHKLQVTDAQPLSLPSSAWFSRDLRAERELEPAMLISPITHPS